MSAEEKKMHEMNLVYAMQYGWIDWFQYFDLWRKL